MNYTLQVARGIAAVLVCFHHLFFHPYLANTDSSILKYTHIDQIGDLAVYFFFALSGYVLTVSTNKKDVSSIVFLKDRVLRIYPEYILWTIIAYAIYSYSEDRWIDINFIPTTFSEWFHTFSLVPPLFNSSEFATLLSVGWSLVYEMYFYILFAFLLLFFRKNKFFIVFGLFFIFYVSYYIGNSNFDIDRYKWVYLPYILTDFHSLAFAGGAYLFYTKQMGFKSQLIPFVMIFSLLAVFIFSKKLLFPEYNFVIISIMVLYLLLNIDFKNRFLILLGDASYTIYLTHVVFSKLAWSISYNHKWWLLLLLNIFVIILGVFLYKFIAEPMNRRIKSYFT